MFIKVRKDGVEKLIECDGYIRTRHAYKGEDTEREPVKQMNLDEPTTEGYRSYTMIDFRPNGRWGAIMVPEKKGNHVFIMNDNGDTVDRWSWDGD